MKSIQLDSLVENKTIQSYELVNVDEDGKIVDKQVGFRNTERLTITFLDASKLIVECFCSGCAENTILEFSANINKGAK